MSFIKRVFLRKLTERAYTFRAITRVAFVAMLLASAATIYCVYYVVPMIATKVAAFNEAMTWEATYVNEQPVATTTAPDKVERYYQEEYGKLKAKYEDALKNAARSAAIERVQEELETEQEGIKQQLREQELFY